MKLGHVRKRIFPTSGVGHVFPGRCKLRLLACSLVWRYRAAATLGALRALRLLSLENCLPAIFSVFLLTH